jgi:lipid-binding SYLF domain-containing protein
MAYASSGMQQLVQGIAGPSLWSYQGTDVHTDVDATDFFTDGDSLGMKVNDIVMVTKTDATIGVTLHTVTVVTAGGAATVAAAILA